MTSACDLRNVRHDAGRSGLGAMPLSFSVLAIVVRAPVCPTLFISPWILRSPQFALSVAMRFKFADGLHESRAALARLVWVVWWAAISLRCHFRMVSGVTIVAKRSVAADRAAGPSLHPGAADRRSGAVACCLAAP